MTTALAEFKLPKIPDQKKLSSQIAPLVDQSKSLVITTEDHFVASWALIERHDHAIKRVGEIFDPFVSGLHNLHKMAVGLRDQFLKPIVISKQELLAKRSVYRREQERIAAETRKKAAELLQKEAAKELTREAKKLEKRGDTEAAGVLFDQAKSVPLPAIAPSAPATPKQSGSVITKRWKWRIVNPDEVQREYCDPTPSKITKVVTALGDKAPIKGIEIWQEESEISRKVGAQ